MAHLNADTRTRAEKTPEEWLKLGSQIATFVGMRANREDVLGFVGEGAGSGAAACWWPSMAEIELNLEAAFNSIVRPADIGNFVNDRSALFEWPKAAGALIHEAGHARWSTSPLEKLIGLDKLVAEVISCFEEPRIERLAVQTWPDDKGFLRASAQGIVMDAIDLDTLKEGAPFDIARLMLLTLARRDAGVLTDDDVADLEAFDIEYFGVVRFKMFEALWLQAVACNKHDETFEVFLPLAKAWMELLPENPHLSEKGKALLAKIGEMVQDAMDSATIGAGDDLGEQESDERAKATVEASEAAGKEAREHAKAADEVFGKGTADVPDRMTRSRVQSKRLPTGPEKAAAITIARQLERARYRDRVETRTQSELPPGRLSTRDAVQGVAQRAAGGSVTSLPWTNTRRKHVEDPNLTVGVMVDISASMRRAMEPMSVTAWMLAEAGRRIQAQTAMVYYGNSAFPTLLPGQHMPEVVIRSAPDSTERFSLAFKALDGKLNLLKGSGARLLVICSDMCYYGFEGDQVKKWTDRCVQAGVGVLSLPYDSGADVAAKHLSKQVQVITGTMDPTRAALVIGQAAVKALQSVSTGR